MCPTPPSAGGEDERPGGQVPFGWLRMYALVLEFLAYVGGLGYLGWWADRQRGWEPWGLLGGLCLGTGLGLYRLIRESKRLGI